MSILIKDMEMPETCDSCPFHVYHSHYEYVCKATPMLYPMNLANSKGIRKNWCPLLEVTERNDRIWEQLSRVYNMDDVPNAAKSIIGDVMLELDGPWKDGGTK